jgi:hypothetical protein
MTSGQHELRFPWLIQLLNAFELPLLELTAFTRCQHPGRAS